MLCFRGTEIGFKDLLTDALIVQLPLDGTKQGACVRSILALVEDLVYAVAATAAADASEKSTNPSTDKRLVHAGFRRAFRSIREAVYTALYYVTHDDLSKWKIDVCGHSLGAPPYTRPPASNAKPTTAHHHHTTNTHKPTTAGGALATLVAHDLATTYPELAASGRLQMYSYGAPRVGNTAFRGI